MPTLNLDKGLLALVAGALLITIAALYLTFGSGGWKRQPSFDNITCLHVPGSPNLIFEGGLLKVSGRVVGRYTFLPGAPGKHGPRIMVENIQVREVEEGISFGPGTDALAWPVTNDSTVKILFSRHGSTVARPCTA